VIVTGRRVRGRPKPITIVIADPQDLVRSGIRCLLEEQADFRIDGEVADGLEAVRLARGRLLEHDLQQTTGTVRLVADSIFIRQAFQRMPGVMGDADQLKGFQAAIDPAVRDFMSVFRWAGVLLILPDGRIGYSSGTTIVAGADVSRGDLAPTGLGLAHRKGMAAPLGHVDVLDFSEPQPVPGPPNAFLASPVLDAVTKQRIGVFVIRRRRASASGETAEAW